MRRSIIALLLFPCSSRGCLTASQIETIKKKCNATALEAGGGNSSTTGVNDPLCVIMVEEPTFIEFDRSRFQGDLSNHFDIFQCKDHSNDVHCLDGTAFDILRRNKDFDKMTCIFASECGFNDVAHLIATADAVKKYGKKQSQNITGMGNRVKLIFAGFILQSHFRIDLGNIFSTPYAFEHLVLVGVVVERIKKFVTPADLLKGAASPGVYALAAAFLAFFAGIIFYYGGNDKYHPSQELDENEDMDANSTGSIQGQAAATQKSVLKQTYERFVSIHHPDLSPQRPIPRRLERLVQLQFLFVACCGGALFLFESVLIFSPRPILPQIRFEQFVRDRKVFLVQDTALQENLYSTFPDLKNYFQNCSNFRECTEDIVPNHPGSYLLTLESIAFSRGLKRYGAQVAVYPTDVNLGTLPGFFIYSSALSAEDRANMDKALLDVSLEPNFVETRIAAHTTHEQEPSRQYLFTTEMLVWGLAIPFLAVLEVEIVVFLLCFVWAISQKCFSGSRQPDLSMNVERHAQESGSVVQKHMPTDVVKVRQEPTFHRSSTLETTVLDNSLSSASDRTRLRSTLSDEGRQLKPPLRGDMEVSCVRKMRAAGKQQCILKKLSTFEPPKGLREDC